MRTPLNFTRRHLLWWVTSLFNVRPSGRCGRCRGLTYMWLLIDILSTYCIFQATDMSAHMSLTDAILYVVHPLVSHSGILYSHIAQLRGISCHWARANHLLCACDARLARARAHAITTATKVSPFCQVFNCIGSSDNNGRRMNDRVRTYGRSWQQTVGDVIFWTVILVFLALSTCLWHWHKTPGRIVTCFVDVGINACTFLQATAAGSVITQRMQALDQVLGDIYLLHHSDRPAALDLTVEKVMPYEALTGSDDVNASLHVVGLLLSSSPRRLRPAPATPRAVSHPPAGALRALREAHALLAAAAASCGRALYVRLCFALATAFTSFVCFGYLTLAVTLDLRPVWFQDSKIAKLSLCAGWMGIFVALFLQLVLTWQGATTAGSAAETRARALLLLPAAAGSNAAESQAELQRLAEALKPRGLLAIDCRLLLAGASAAATSLVVLLQFHTAEAVLGP